MSNVNPIPEGFHSVTPHMVIKNAAEAIEFYKKAFGAEELSRHTTPSGQLVMHATLKLGNSMLMVSDEFPEAQGCPGWVSPQTNAGTTVTLHLYVEDVDAVFKQAVDAGCKPNTPPMDAFWGHRYGQVFDPYGHSWSIATHKADLTQKDIAEAAAEVFKDAPSSQ